GPLLCRCQHFSFSIRSQPFVLPIASDSPSDGSGKVAPQVLVGGVVPALRITRIKRTHDGAAALRVTFLCQNPVLSHGSPSSPPAVVSPFGCVSKQKGNNMAMELPLPPFQLE